MNSLNNTPAAPRVKPPMAPPTESLVTSSLLSMANKFIEELTNPEDPNHNRRMEITSFHKLFERY